MQERFAVDIENDGDAGLGAALAEDYDLLIVDWMLPGGTDGLELCRRVREAGKSTPILMLSAKDKIPEKVGGLNAGADDYLTKPFAFDELLARVRALLRRPTQNKGRKLEVGELSLDTISYHVERAGNPIGLSAKEFALLEYLMRNQGHVMSKDQIIAHVWDFDADILPNTVEVYIGYLRNKIDKPFKDELIVTKRGFGYMIGAPK